MSVLRRGWMWVVAFGVLFSVTAARADDVDAIRAAFESDIKLFNAQNKTAFSVNAHDDVVVFGTLTPFAIEGKAALVEFMENYFADQERAKFTPINAEYRAIGDSGLAWGHYTISELPKVGGRELIHGRYTFTYVKKDGDWRLLVVHVSPLFVE